MNYIRVAIFTFLFPALAIGQLYGFSQYSNNEVRIGAMYKDCSDIASFDIMASRSNQYWHGTVRIGVNICDNLIVYPFYFDGILDNGVIKYRVPVLLSYRVNKGCVGYEIGIDTDIFLNFGLNANVFYKIN